MAQQPANRWRAVPSTLLTMNLGTDFTRSEISTYYAARVPQLKQRRAGQWRGPCPIHKGKDDNFAVEPDSGRWFCHSACGRGGDIFTLEDALNGGDFPTRKAEVFRLVGRSQSGHHRNGAPKAVNQRRKANSQEHASPDPKMNAQNGPPQPEPRVLAEVVRRKLTRRGYHVVAEYNYSNSLRKVRFEHESKQQDKKQRPEKTFLWEHLADGSWYSGDGGAPKPLYLSGIFRERDQVGPVVGFEGEAKADVAGEFGIAAFSFKDITREQAATLVDCDVVLWPDNDESGSQQTENAARTINEDGHARSIKLITPPPELSSAGDIIDAVRGLGWDGPRVLQFLKTARPYTNSGPAAGKKPSERLPFQVSDDGVFFLKECSDGSTEPIRLAARVDVVAQTRDEAGENWGRLLRWRDDEGRLHQWAMPMETLASDSGGVRARLLSEGLSFITTNMRYRERFSEYLQTAPVEQRARCVARIGWHRDTFVLPDQAIGPDRGEEVLYQPSYDAVHHWKVRGTAEEWREQVGRRCGGNSRLIVAAACGFAGPILRLIGTESGGIHFHGSTSTGKSTALVVGGSVCGGGGPTGFVQTWRTTINGLEAVAEAHNDGTLFIDELAQVDPRDAAETAYLLGNGQGKSRMTRNIGLRNKLTWTFLYVSSGEVTLADHAASAGRRTTGGAEVRLLNIDADAGHGLGLFETLHGIASPDAFARELKDAASRYYGAPLRAFLVRLTKDRSETERRVRTARDAFSRQHVPAAAAGEVQRAADRFALIGAAGELATEWGLTGWRQGESTEAAERCFQEWMEKRGTVGASDIEKAVRRVRGFLETHGTSRFQAIRHPLRAGSDDNPDEAQVIRDRAGFRRRNPETGETEYLILLETFKAEVCIGHPYQAVLKELDRRGFLVREPPNLTIKPNLPEIGRVRVYCIRAAILEADEC
jgi:putative DNA primase/helicase